MSKGKNHEQNSSHTMNIGSTLLRTYCLFLFTFAAEREVVTEKMYETILDGLEDAKSGNIDGDTAISNIRSKYGI